MATRALLVCTCLISGAAQDLFLSVQTNEQVTDKILEETFASTQTNQTKAAKNQCVIRSVPETGANLVWKFGWPSCLCNSQGIYGEFDLRVLRKGESMSGKKIVTKDGEKWIRTTYRDQAFAGALEAKWDDGKCRCRDSQGEQMLPSFNSQKLCNREFCWDIYKRLAIKQPKTGIITNVWKSDPSPCAVCDDEAGPPCDAVELGPKFTKKELEKKKKSGDLGKDEEDALRDLCKNGACDDDEEDEPSKPRPESPVEKLQKGKCPPGVIFTMDYKSWPRAFSCCIGDVCRSRSERVPNVCCHHKMEEGNEDDGFDDDDDEDPDIEDPGTCDEQMTRNLETVNLLLNQYMVDCQLKTTDIEKNQRDGKVTVKDKTRLCSKNCQDTMDERTKNLFDIDEFEMKCPGHKDLDTLKTIHAAILVLRASQATCTDDDSGDDGTTDVGTCPDLAMTYQDCGQGNAKDCAAKGCCWNPKTPEETQEERESGRGERRSRAWCYHTRKNFKQCEVKCPATAYDKEKREDCAAFLIADDVNNPDAKVRGNACEAVGCCWQPLEENSKHPWCFYKPCV